MAPATITLAAPAGFASYQWATDGGCTGIPFPPLDGGITDTLTLTSGFDLVVTFDVSSAATLSCGFMVTVTDAYGSSATSSTVPITVRLPARRLPAPSAV